MRITHSSTDNLKHTIHKVTRAEEAKEDQKKRPWIVVFRKMSFVDSADQTGKTCHSGNLNDKTTLNQGCLVMNRPHSELAQLTNLVGQKSLSM